MTSDGPKDGREERPLRIGTPRLWDELEPRLAAMEKGRSMKDGNVQASRNVLEAERRAKAQARQSSLFAEVRDARDARRAAERLSNARAYRNPANGYVEYIDGAWIWCLLFGCFYLLYKGAWGAAVMAFLLALITLGLSWLIFPFFARAIVAKAYLRRGWVPATS